MKLSIKEIFEESALLYNKNFECFMGFTVIYVSIRAFWIALEIAFDAFRNLPTTSELITSMGSLFIFMLGVVVVMFIFGPRFLLAILVQINSIVNEKPMKLEQSYMETKGKYWIALGCIILVVLISELPILILFFFDLGNSFLELLISSIYVAAIYALFFMLLPVIALSKNTKGYIGRAVKLIRGNYLKVLFWYILTTSLLYFAYVTVEIELLEISSRIVVGIIYLLALLFIFPFSQVVRVVIYRKLADENEPEVGQEMVEGYIITEQHDFEEE